jgi:protein TonB
MNFSPNLQATRSRWWGFAAVLALHLLVGWALVEGLVRPAVAPIKTPVQVALVAEAPPPTPPPPPPPPEFRIVPKAAPAQKTVAAPPPQAPAPVVQAAATDLPSPAAITPTPPAPPAPPEVLVAAPSATALATLPAPVVTQAASVVCPYQAKPAWPRFAIQNGITGTVKVKATVRAGKVIAVQVLSSSPPSVFEAVARQAMLQFRCESPPGIDTLVEQDFNFNLE